MNTKETYEGAIERALFTAEEIASAIARLATQIAEDHRRQPLTLIGVLKGALYVVTDLARALAAIPDGPSEIIVDYRPGAGIRMAPHFYTLDSELEHAVSEIRAITEGR